LKDTSKHKGLRKKLVDELIKKGIKSQSVLNIINQIPRHLFIDRDFESHAYVDKAFPIGSDQTISQPYTVAFQTSLLNLKENDKVLEIGTGSGYQTAILVKLKAKVYTIERQHDLYRKVIKKLPLLGYEPELIKYGDGYLGLKEHAPFDKIIITAGARQIPKKLLLQLKIGGSMVIPLGYNTQKMTYILRTSKNKYEKKILGDFKFVPMLKNKN
jgi:protein-L-isoaspartate(D-aspartate) O-methyltransferase